MLLYKQDYWNEDNYNSHWRNKVEFSFKWRWSIDIGSYHIYIKNKLILLIFWRPFVENKNIFYKLWTLFPWMNVWYYNIFQISPGTPGEICRWYFHPLLGKQRQHGLVRAEWLSPQPSALETLAYRMRGACWKGRN